MPFGLKDIVLGFLLAAVAFAYGVPLPNFDRLSQKQSVAYAPGPSPMLPSYGSGTRSYDGGMSYDYPGIPVQPWNFCAPQEFPAEGTERI